MSYHSMDYSQKASQHQQSTIPQHHHHAVSNNNSNNNSTTSPPEHNSPNQANTPPTNSGGTPRSNRMHIPHAIQEINGKNITVVWLDDRRWMIGVQVASLLERETYNLYRSMKVKNIEVRRATVEQIEYLLKHEIVRTGTRSITFVSLDQSINFLADELKKLEKKRHKAAMIVSGQLKSDIGPPIVPHYFDSSSEYSTLASRSAPTALRGGADYSNSFGSSFPPTQYQNDMLINSLDGAQASNISTSYNYQQSNFGSASFPSLSSFSTSSNNSVSSTNSIGNNTGMSISAMNGGNYPTNNSNNSYSVSSSFHDEAGPMKLSHSKSTGSMGSFVGQTSDRNMFHPYHLQQ